MSKIMREMYAEALRSRQEPEKVLRRYTVDKDDVEGRRNLDRVIAQYGCVLEVLVNGNVLDYCTVADEINGVAVAFEQPFRLVSGQPATFEVRGVVRVVPKLT